MKNTYNFDFKQGEFVFEKGTAVVLTERNALMLWVEKAIRTQIDRYNMYSGKNTVRISRIGNRQKLRL